MTRDELRQLAQPICERMGVDVNTVVSIVLTPEESYVEFMDHGAWKTKTEAVA